MSDQNKLYDAEIFYVSKYDSLNNGYNLTAGGLHNGFKMPEEAKAKIGAKNKINMTGKKLSKETKEKMSNSHKGYVKTSEHRKHLSESLTGIKRSEETKEKCRQANIGEKQPTSKNTEEMIREIRIKFKNGASAKDLSKEYGIPVGTLYGIKYYKRWKHVVT
jgi:hypothetical protein